MGNLLSPMGNLLSPMGNLLSSWFERESIEGLNEEDGGTESVSRSDPCGDEKSAIGREQSAEERLELLTQNEGVNRSSCGLNTNRTKDIHESAHHKSEKYNSSAVLSQGDNFPPPFRYATYVNKWNLTEQNWRTVLNCISTNEAEATKRFLFDKDKRMALGSRLLHRKVACKSFGMDWKDVEVERRKGYKPMLRYRHAPKTWNMNVSHHGGLVAIASDSHRLCGVDTMDLSEADMHCNSSDKTESYLSCFQENFTQFEWSHINGITLHSQCNNRDRIHRFLIQWSMKEAYVKAIGEGLYFNLLRVEFEGKGDNPNRPTSAIVRVDKQELKGWNLRLQYIGTHVLCVALGKSPSSLGQTNEESLNLDFELLGLHDILPRSIASALQ